MKTNAICPISFKKIDENVSRINAGLTVLLLLLSIISGSSLPIIFLAADFLLRSAELSTYSPLAILSRNFLRLVESKPKLVNAGPKLFAARIGFVFSVAILLFNVLQLPVVAVALTAVFGLCAFLEAAFSFCVACQVYPYVYKLTYSWKTEKI